MQKYISFSGGVESTTMCLLYGKGAKAIVCDTGDEEPLMYGRWNYVEQAMKIIHDGDFELIRLKPTVTHKKKQYDNLNDLAMAYGFFPGAGSRYCTGKFKIDPIDQYLSGLSEVDLLIGLNSDEDGEREGNWEKLKNVNYRYPLADDGYSRQDCIDILTEFDLQPKFPVYMSRGGCRKCFFRTRKHAKAKYFFDKDGFIQDMQFEEDFNRNHTKKKFYGINLNFKSGYRQIMDECEQEIAMFGLDAMKAMYSTIEEHKTCGIFCHR